MKNKQTKLICMSFDGDYQIERPTFESIDKAWNYSNDLGSKWYFYPYHFVVTASGKTVVDAGQMLEHLIGQRVKAVAAHFKAVSEKPENQNMNTEEYTFAL